MQPKYILNGANMTSRENAHNELYHALKLPQFYGRNLDALNDVLSSINAEVEFQNVGDMLNSLGAYGCRMLQVIYNAAKDNDNFTIVCVR